MHYIEHNKYTITYNNTQTKKADQKYLKSASIVTKIQKSKQFQRVEMKNTQPM